MYQQLKIGQLVLKNRYILAPMAGWTNLSYRTLCRQFGCSLAFTEMIKARAFVENSQRTLEMLKSNSMDKPLGVQLLGQDDAMMSEAAQRLEDMGVDIIDINMGCPVPKVVCKGEGAALLKEPKKVSQVLSKIRSAIQIPLTLKMRSGWDEKNKNALEIVKIAEEAGVDAITIHGRTKEQMYSGRCDRTIIQDVKANTHIPILASGDLFTPVDIQEMLVQTGCDGVWLARGTMGRPWIFKAACEYIESGRSFDMVNPDLILKSLKEHFTLLVQEVGDKNAILEIRKVASQYLKDFPKSSEVRNHINQVQSQDEFYNILNFAQKVMGIAC